MISIIVAMDGNRVIGKNNQLPWHISDDLKNFKKLTSGNTIIMGRKTFESIGKPLPNRINIVVSTSMPETKGVVVCRSVPEAVANAKMHGKDIFIIGGSQIFEQTISLADKMYISHVKKNYAGDVFFPEFEDKDWKAESKQDFPDFELAVYVRRNG